MLMSRNNIIDVMPTSTAESASASSITTKFTAPKSTWPSCRRLMRAAVIVGVVGFDNTTRISGCEGIVLIKKKWRVQTGKKALIAGGVGLYAGVKSVCAALGIAAVGVTAASKLDAAKRNEGGKILFPSREGGRPLSFTRDVGGATLNPLYASPAGLRVVSKSAADMAEYNFLKDGFTTVQFTPEDFMKAQVLEKAGVTDLYKDTPSAGRDEKLKKFAEYCVRDVHNKLDSPMRKLVETYLCDEFSKRNYDDLAGLAPHNLLSFPSAALGNSEAKLEMLRQTSSKLQETHRTRLLMPLKASARQVGILPPQGQSDLISRNGLNVGSYLVQNPGPVAHVDFKFEDEDLFRNALLFNSDVAGLVESDSILVKLALSRSVLPLQYVLYNGNIKKLAKHYLGVASDNQETLMQELAVDLVRAYNHRSKYTVKESDKEALKYALSKESLSDETEKAISENKPHTIAEWAAHGLLNVAEERLRILLASGHTIFTDDESERSKFWRHLKVVGGIILWTHLTPAGTNVDIDRNPLLPGLPLSVMSNVNKNKLEGKRKLRINSTSHANGRPFKPNEFKEAAMQVALGDINGEQKPIQYSIGYAEHLNHDGDHGDDEATFVIDERIKQPRNGYIMDLFTSVHAAVDWKNEKEVGDKRLTVETRELVIELSEEATKQLNAL